MNESFSLLLKKILTMNVIMRREAKNPELTVSRVLDNSGMVKTDTKESGWKKENGHILYQYLWLMCHYRRR